MNPDAANQALWLVAVTDKNFQRFLAKMFGEKHTALNISTNKTQIAMLWRGVFYSF